jgi:hypothetical protein
MPGFSLTGCDVGRILHGPLAELFSEIGYGWWNRETSNRTVVSRGRLIELLDDARYAVVAKKLLDRYTDQSFDTPQQWRQWFDGNKGRFYFGDVGGYKFFIVPEGYLAGRENSTVIGKSPYR